MLKHKWLVFFLLIGVAILQSNVFAEDYSTRYYRQLIYNHISPYYPIRGNYEIPAEAAQKAPYYIFKYDGLHRIVEIINHNPETWKQHPLTHMAIYRTVISYTKDAETRIYFNEKKDRVANVRQVYQEVYRYDPSGFKKSLEFYDLNGKPMESNWGVSRYCWEKKNGWIVEKRFDKHGILTPVSPYFPFYITGIKFNEKGFSTGCYNLNENLEVIDSSEGIASYLDKYDANGNHIEYAYYNKDNQRAYNGARFAISRKYYDGQGNIVKEEFLNKDQKPINVYSYQYDANGYLVNKIKEN